MNDTTEYPSNEQICCTRRTVLKTAFGVTIAGIAGFVGVGTPGISYAAALTKEKRDKLTPDQVISRLKGREYSFSYRKNAKA